MKLEKGQFVVTIKDVEKYLQRLYERREKKYKKTMTGCGEQYLRSWQETCQKIDNVEKILGAMRAAKVAQVDPTLTQLISLPPQQ